MIGWHISVKRQLGGGHLPASFNSECGESLAVWQTWPIGRDWLEDFVQKSRIMFLGGNGMPFRYTAAAKEILPMLLPKPPHAKDVWHFDPGDVLTEKWHGKTFLDHQGLAQCSPEEWLLIEVWDES
jgi:hypothetical protein